MRRRFCLTLWTTAWTGYSFENIDHVLAGRKLDALVVQHMEPDHAATIQEVVRRYPGVRFSATRRPPI